jgi:hypothetical protein
MIGERRARISSLRRFQPGHQYPPLLPVLLLLLLLLLPLWVVVSPCVSVLGEHPVMAKDKTIRMTTNSELDLITVSAARG